MPNQAAIYVGCAGLHRFGWFRCSKILYTRIHNAPLFHRHHPLEEVRILWMPYSVRMDSILLQTSVIRTIAGVQYRTTGRPQVLVNSSLEKRNKPELPGPYRRSNRSNFCCSDEIRGRVVALSSMRFARSLRVDHREARCDMFVRVPSPFSTTNRGNREIRERVVVHYRIGPNIEVILVSFDFAERKASGDDNSSEQENGLRFADPFASKRAAGGG